MRREAGQGQPLARACACALFNVDTSLVLEDGGGHCEARAAGSLMPEDGNGHGEAREAPKDGDGHCEARERRPPGGVLGASGGGVSTSFRCQLGGTEKRMQAVCLWLLSLLASTCLSMCASLPTIYFSHWRQQKQQHAPAARAVAPQGNKSRWQCQVVRGGTPRATPTRRCAPGARAQTACCRERSAAPDRFHSAAQTSCRTRTAFARRRARCARA